MQTYRVHYIYMHASPTSNKITITTRDVSRPQGKVCCSGFVIDLYCRHFVPYLVLALIINHCFNKLRLPTQQASPPNTNVGSQGIFDGFVAGGETTCHALGKANSALCSTDSQPPYSTSCQITFPPGAMHKYRRLGEERNTELMGG